MPKVLISDKMDPKAAEIFLANGVEVHEKTGLSKKDSELAVNASLETITETLIQGEKVQLVGFGAFDVKERGVRMGRNPKTKKEIEIPASRGPQFKAGKALKEAVDKK